MSTKQEIPEIVYTLMEQLRVFPQIKRVILFGSRARGDAEERS